jgi:hypothetical protein
MGLKPRNLLNFNYRWLKPTVIEWIKNQGFSHIKNV